MTRPRPPVCPSCALPQPDATDLLGPAGGRCARCIVTPPPLDGVRAAFLYDGLARRFLLRAKLGRRPELFRQLARQMGALIARWPAARDCTVAVPVPSVPWANLRRGFDPARTLARPLARPLGLPVRSLIRRAWRPAAPQKRLGAARRLQCASKDAFRAGSLPRHSRVLLVDDVMTTGATLAACAAALRAAGAAKVVAAVWARTPLEPRRTQF